MPAACAACGYRLVRVMPGRELASKQKMSPCGAHPEVDPRSSR